MQKKQTALNFDVRTQNYLTGALGNVDVIEVNEKISELVNDEKFLDQLAHANKKIIAVNKLTDLSRSQILQVIDELSTLHRDVSKKNNEIQAKSVMIRQKVDALLGSGKVNIDQAEYKKSEASILQYSTMLNNICSELEAEKDFFSLFLSDKCPSHVIVLSKASDCFEEIAAIRVRLLRSYLKTVCRDLSISYSRYSYGFETQLNRISYIESCIKNEGK